MTDNVNKERPEVVIPADAVLLKIAEVAKIARVSKATIYNLVRDGNFPAQVKIGPNCVAWRRSDVMRHLGLEEWPEVQAA